VLVGKIRQTNDKEYLYTGRFDMPTGQTLENSYYDAIYDVTAEDESHDKKAVILNKFKTKLIRLNNYNNKRVLVDNHDRDMMEGEDPSIFHIIRTMKRKDTRTITSIQDQNGITHTPPRKE
jgi:hypothetical protein